MTSRAQSMARPRLLSWVFMYSMFSYVHLAGATLFFIAAFSAGMPFTLNDTGVPDAARFRCLEQGLFPLSKK